MLIPTFNNATVAKLKKPSIMSILDNNHFPSLNNNYVINTVAIITLNTAKETSDIDNLIPEQMTLLCTVMEPLFYKYNVSLYRHFIFRDDILRWLSSDVTLAFSLLDLKITMYFYQ